MVALDEKKNNNLDEKKSKPHEKVVLLIGWKKKIKNLKKNTHIEGLITLSRQDFHIVHHIQPLLHPSKHHVLAVEVGGVGTRDEELRPVGVRTGVGHW